MRIFYAARDTAHASLTSSMVWYINQYLPLVDLGHDVVRFDYDIYYHRDSVGAREFIAVNRPKLEEALLRQIKAAQREKTIDLFFSYLSDAHVRPRVIHEIRQMGIVTVNWFCNASYQIHLVKDISPAYDYCLVPEKFRLVDYRQMGANPIYCQEAANPNIYKPFDLPKEFDVTFIGSRYGERAGHIRKLSDHGVNVRVWGVGWQPSSATSVSHLSEKHTLISKLGRLRRPDGWKAVARRFSRKRHSTQEQVEVPPEICGPSLSDDKMVKIYSRSKISLGLSGTGNLPNSQERIVQIRLRDFEAPMCGAFYMVEYMAELEEFFEIGKEIVCYEGPDDLLDKVRYYLTHESEREQIRQAGFQRALRDHTWHKRFKNVFKEIGISQV